MFRKYYKLANLPMQSRIFKSKRARALVLLIGCISIPIWQYFFFINKSNLDKQYVNKASTGLHGEHRFVYFYYYLGLYPIATENHKNLTYTKDGAKKELAEHGDKLLMEVGYPTIRHGDLGKMFLYLPSALLNGAPKKMNVQTCHILFFVFALVSLFVSFCWIRQPVLGIIFVLLLGSNPFQLYEVYTNGNVFGWPISTAILILAINLPLLTERKRSALYLFAVPVLTGIIMALIRQLRSEPMPIILSVIVSYMLVCKTRPRIKVSMLLLLLVSFVGTSSLSQSYFSNKFEEAFKVVKDAGGHPYTAQRYRYHAVWIPVWCGLSDFDTTHGYEWADYSPTFYANPILKKKYNMDLPDWGTDKWHSSRYRYNLYWDIGKKYFKMPYEMPHYLEVIRDKVIDDIVNEPLWYSGIILKRIRRVISQTTPLRLSFGRVWVTIPLGGMTFFFVFLVLLFFKDRMLLKLLCFSIPLSTMQIVIYSGKGMCFYSCYHIFAAAILMAWLVELGFYGYEKYFIN